MGEKIKIWLEKPLFVYFFGLFFLIFKTAQFFDYFEWETFVSFLLLYNFLNYSLIRIAQKSRLENSIHGWLLSSWITILFAMNIVQQIEIRFHMYFSVYLLLIYLFTFYLIFFWFRKKLNNHIVRLANKSLNLFFIFFSIIVLISGIQTAYKERKEGFIKNESTLPIIRHKEDLIWILLDEYASPTVLERQFSFKISLSDSLRMKGFYVFDSIKSRSDATIYSLNALFNLDDSLPKSNYQYAANELKKSTWINQLERNGYEFTNLSFLNIGSKPKFRNIYLFPDNYKEKIFNNTLFAFCYFKLNKIDEKMRIDDYNNGVLKTFQKIIHQQNINPTFIFMHLLIPHLPFYRRADGHLNSFPIYDPMLFSKEQLKDQYLNYYMYANSIVLQTLRTIPDWQNKTIVISGDHGIRSLLAEKDKQRFLSFAAIHCPKIDSSKLKEIKFLQQIPSHL